MNVFLSCDLVRPCELVRDGAPASHAAVEHDRAQSHGVRLNELQKCMYVL